MAGLGTNVSNSASLRTRMGGSAVINGSSVTTWFFAPVGTNQGFMGDRHLPSAHVELIEGQASSILFDNTSPMEHTIHLHGMDVDQANDGVPATSPVVPPHGSYNYQFIAPHAGTYHYHCHVDTVLHYAMGMYGTVIVRPPDASTTQAWTGGPTFDEEVLWHLSTVDTSWHTGGLQTSGTHTARFHPDGFLLNGKQTTDALLDTFTKVVVGVGQKAYIRVVNAAYQDARVSLGGRPFQVVASDGRPMQTVQTRGTLVIGPGERYDLLFTGVKPEAFEAQVDYLDNANRAVLGSVRTKVEVV